MPWWWPFGGRSREAITTAITLNEILQKDIPLFKIELGEDISKFNNFRKHARELDSKIHDLMRSRTFHNGEVATMIGELGVVTGNLVRYAEERPEYRLLLNTVNDIGYGIRRLLKKL